MYITSTIIFLNIYIQKNEKHYALDLTMSNNVNIEGNDLIIEKIVPANTTKVNTKIFFFIYLNLQILTIAIAQADSWYLSIKNIKIN